MLEFDLRLAFARNEGKGTPLNLEEVDSLALLQEAAPRFSSLRPDRPLRLEIQTDLPLLDADRVLIMRVVLNLLENAAKYSPANQPIVMRTGARRRPAAWA